MNHVVTRVEQPKLVQLFITVRVEAVWRAPHMGADDQVHFLGEPEIVFDDFPGGEIHAECGHGERDHAVIVGQGAFPQAFQLGTGMRDMGEGKGAFLGVGLG